MSYLQKYYIMAENELYNRKKRNSEQEQLNIALAEEKIPQIRELRGRFYHWVQDWLRYWCQAMIRKPP